MTTVRSERRSAPRRLMPTAPRKSGRCGGSLGLEPDADEHASIWRGTGALEPTFVASHTCLASAFSNQIIIVQSDWHLIFILTQMNSNIERITQMSSQMASFFLRGFFAIYPPTHGRVPFPQGTGVLPVPIESATRERPLNNQHHSRKTMRAS
jgi:hypothetical protein